MNSHFFFIILYTQVMVSYVQLISYLLQRNDKKCFFLNQQNGFREIRLFIAPLSSHSVHVKIRKCVQ